MKEWLIYWILNIPSNLNTSKFEEFTTFFVIINLILDFILYMHI